ncbi:hypothetical protein ANANG_G00210500 [Anguilla anguilla]|uniref:Uncharacterized protein n=1 Tax=Anguilla anguilla TaxID=7936 RepID=A0A9D3M3C3_ANGAN|nr:hypothetical protein ANANG_G00210500 [Anguilla anguilla]
MPKIPAGLPLLRPSGTDAQLNWGRPSGVTLLKPAPRLSVLVNPRLTHDISLDEFEDEDLSELTEITDDCGMSLNCNGVDIKGQVTRRANRGPGKAEGGPRQAAGGGASLGPDRRGGRAATVQPRRPPGPPAKEPAPVAMDTYRPKRPTTLNLFPQVPRTQDTLNNNSFGKKYSWQEKVSCSSSPLKTGELTPAHVCLSDEDKVQHGVGAQTKDRGTSMDPSCQKGSKTRDGPAQARAPPRRLRARPYTQAPPPGGAPRAHPLPPRGRAAGAHRGDLPDARAEGPPASRTGTAPRVRRPGPRGPPPYRPLPTGHAAPSARRAGLRPAPAPDPDPNRRGGATGSPGAPRTSAGSEASGLSYDSVKYTLVVDEHAQLELVSLRQCYRGYSDDSDSATVYDNCVSSPTSRLWTRRRRRRRKGEPEEGEAGSRPPVGGLQPRGRPAVFAKVPQHLHERSLAFFQ